MKTRAAVVSLAVALSSVWLAGAQTSAPDKLAADTLFREARTAMEAADYATAYKKLLRSQHLDPAVGTLLNLGVCEEHLGRIADALAHFRQAFSTMKPGDDRLARTRDRIQELARRVPTLRISLAGTPAGTRVRRDDTELSVHTLDVEVEVNPGRHVVEYDVPGRGVIRYQVLLADGDRMEQRLDASPIAPRLATSTHAQQQDSSRRTLGFVIGGVGVAGLAVGITSGIMLSSKRNTIAAHCNTDTRICDAPSGVDAASSAKVLWPVSMAGWGVGLAGIGIGTWLLLTGAERSATSTNVGALILPGRGAGLNMQGAF